MDPNAHPLFKGAQSIDGDELIPANDPYPLPSEPTYLPVTPEMASSWLSYRNHPKNRRLSKSIAGKYQADMEAGRWPDGSPEPLIFDEGGYIISAQHRLKALANSGKTITLFITPNVPRSFFEVVDQGYKRQAAHVLGVPNASAVGAAARHLAALKANPIYSLSNFGRITTPEIVTTARQWPELTWYSTGIMNVRLRTYIPGGPHLAVLAQAARTEYRPKIEEWIKGLETGFDLGGTDPRAHLRQRFLTQHHMMQGSKNRDLVYSLIVKAWNAYATGTPMRTLRHMITETLAKVEDFTFEKNEEDTP